MQTVLFRRLVDRPLGAPITRHLQARHLRRWIFVVLLLALGSAGKATRSAVLSEAPEGASGELLPLRILAQHGPPSSLSAVLLKDDPLARSLSIAAGRSVGLYSQRTVTVALEIDRDAARVVAFTSKDRPFEQPLEMAAPRFYRSGSPLQVEVVLHGPAGRTYTRRIDAGKLCLDHPPGAPPHIEGDTIRLHKDSFLVELPELEGFDRVEAAFYREQGGLPVRQTLGSAALASDRFTPAGAKLAYTDLAFATATRAGQVTSPLTAGTVHWPEEFNDADRYTVYGNAAEITKRINVVLVPDGYTYPEKALMQSHAQTIVDAFRNRTPYKEHDRFINYILVYAYSTESGTDECDCASVKDTAMNTRFPLRVSVCGDHGNRCLYYGTGNGGPDCDTNTATGNIVAAELRAPALDTTIIMVNTARPGGCEGGSRAVFSAAAPNAGEIAIHELGHAIASLDDEYGTASSCGLEAGEINTSRNPTVGSWPEWIGDLGAPSQGAQYYTTCIYRPTQNCEMRELGQEFCPVCRQQWALSFFGNSRVHPTAPVESGSPPYFVYTQVGLPVDFSLTTRLATGPNVTNDFSWLAYGPGFPVPTVVATGTPNLARAFAEPGSYLFWCEVLADTNDIKPERNGPNLGAWFWDVYVAPVPEVSADPILALMVERNGANVDIRFEDTGSTRYNLYVSTLAGTSPFDVSGPGAGKKECGLAGLTSIGGGLKQISGYDPGAALAGISSIYFLLVTADNGPGTEGSLGTNSSGAERIAQSYCNR